jgi:hypothetical protein
MMKLYCDKILPYKDINISEESVIYFGYDLFYIDEQISIILVKISVLTIF